MTAATYNAIDRLTAAYSAQPDGPAWLGELRAAGMARFEALGFPTTRHEDWRFTNLKPLADLPFQSAAGNAGAVLAGTLFTGI